jgi:hypothetical protein
MTTSTLPLSLEGSARVCLRSRRVLPLATGGTGAEVDAFAATFGFAELSVNAVANAWSSDVGKFILLLFPLIVGVLDHHDLLRRLLLRPLLLPLPRTRIGAARSVPVALERILQHVHQLVRA